MTSNGSTGWRFRFFAAALLLFAGYCGQKLIRSHLDPSVAAPDYGFTEKLMPRRGGIYSSYGKNYPLVKSVPYWEYHLDPFDLTNAVVNRVRRKKPLTQEEILEERDVRLKTISGALGFSYAKLREMAEVSSGPSWRSQFIRRSTDPDAHELIVTSRVSGVAIRDCQVRSYLHHRSLCHVLGAVNAEGVGAAGIEAGYERYLAGTEGLIQGKRDARRREIYDKREVSIPAIPGDDIYLTIEQNIQFEAEAALRWGLSEFGAGAGWCIVMDAETAEIKAMASMPDYHPEMYSKASDNSRINRAVAFNYEPGSVMKVITACAALDSNPRRWGPNTRYNTNRNDDRYYKLPGDGSHVWEPTMTLTDAIVHSSNIVIGKLGCDVGPQMLWTYMDRFGFGRKTGVGLPGEQYGILHNWKKWDKATWSRAAIGQGIGVTAIQLISAYQAIANDGVRMRPYIVSKIVGHDGSVKLENRPQPVCRVMKASTARTIRTMMLGVASPSGTARRAAIRGYSVAGKTGTAQKVVGRGYAPGLYRATFCGMIPANDPRLVVLVTLDFDKAGMRYHQGGNSAGPVFKRIANASLRFLGIPPDRPDELEDVDPEDNDYDRLLDERLSE